MTPADQLTPDRRDHLAWGSHPTVLRLFLALALFSGSARAQVPAQPAGEAPEEVTADDWAGIRAAHEAELHRVRASDHGHTARNPGQRWTTRFDGTGFTATPDDRDWSWGLELQRYGWGAAARRVEEPVEVEAVGSRVSYDWDEQLTEWYLNDRRGLEHGFTVHTRPAGATGQLWLTLAVRGELRAAVSTDGRDIRFVDDQGGAALTYAGLTVFDAAGRSLAARWQREADGLHLCIEDEGARYPLTIDPIAQQAYLKASNADGGDRFGYAVAVCGDTLVVGAPFEDSAGTGVDGDQDNSAMSAGAAYVFVRDGESWSQQAYLKASNTDEGDEFGLSVAISGDTVVVGAHNEDSASAGVDGEQHDNSDTNPGAAYVFVRNGKAWSQQAYLKASNTDSFDEFGWAVAVSGDTIVVGAPGESSASTGVNGGQGSDGALYAGAAYVFVRDGTTWSQQAYLKAFNTGLFDGFGGAVAVSGDTVVVGAGSQGPGSAGAAYVFERQDTTWSQEGYLKPSSPGLSDDFGESVAISGNTIVVGAPREDSSAVGVNGDQEQDHAESSGASYVFVRDEATWSLQAYLKASNTDPDDRFGSSVAISGDTVVVGALGEESHSTGVNGDQGNNDFGAPGAAYVFVRTGSTWGQQAYVKASNTQSFDRFGGSVSVSGDTIAVGAREEGGSSGATYVFESLCPSLVQSREQQRLGDPPNPTAFLPGRTYGPVLGTAWDPVVDHATFAPDSVVDFLLVSTTALEVDLGAPGTQLCGPALLPVLLAPAPGLPFQVPVPADCALLGLDLCTQGGSLMGDASFSLTNALDVTLGNFTIKPLTAEFGADKLLDLAPLTVQFSNESLSSYAGVEYAWDFGDPSSPGNTSTLENPAHTYLEPGTYAVTLTASNEFEQATIAKPGLIQVLPFEPPIADFSVSADLGLTPLAVHFTNQSQGYITSYLWDFGDPTSLDNTSTVANPTHLYAEEGSYTVTLSVANAAGQDTVVKRDLIKSFDELIVDFTAVQTSGSAPLTVNFTNLTSPSFATSTWYFEWPSTLATSTDQHPVYTYDQPGTYAVFLGGAFASATDTELKLGFITVE